MLRPRRIRGSGLRRNYPSKLKVYIVARRIKMHFLHPAVEVAGRREHILPFPLIHVGPDCVAVRAMKLGVYIQERLHIVIAGRNFTEGADGITGRGTVNGSSCSWLETIDVNSEERSAHISCAGLKAGLLAHIARNDHKHAAGRSLRMN